jgi:hypothetical protein
MSKPLAMAAALVFTSGTAALSQLAAAPPSAALESYTHAREVLDRALTASGDRRPSRR